MKNQRGFTLYQLLLVLVWVFSIIGWVWNIVKLIAIVDGAITGTMFLRTVGIFIAPLGVVLGYL